MIPSLPPFMSQTGDRSVIGLEPRSAVLKTAGITRRCLKKLDAIAEVHQRRGDAKAERAYTRASVWPLRHSCQAAGQEHPRIFAPKRPLPSSRHRSSQLRPAVWPGSPAAHLDRDDGDVAKDPRNPLPIRGSNPRYFRPAQRRALLQTPGRRFREDILRHIFLLK